MWTLTVAVTDLFYEHFESLSSTIPSHNFLVLAGDFNAEPIGSVSRGVIGPHTPGHKNYNSQWFLEILLQFWLQLPGTYQPRPLSHRQTWISPDGITKKELDHMAIRQSDVSSVHKCRVCRSADCNSDHQLVVMKLQISLKMPYQRPCGAKVSKPNFTDPVIPYMPVL